MNQSHCRGFVGNIKVADLNLADDTVIFVEPAEVLAMGLKALYEKINLMDITERILRAVG